jgi:hypothetical protein
MSDSQICLLRQSIIDLLKERQEEGIARPIAGAVVVNPAGEILLGAPCPWGQRGHIDPAAPLALLPCDGLDEKETSVQAVIRIAREIAHVTAAPVRGIPAFLRISRHLSTDPLGYGSPRLIDGSKIISQAAADLLLQAAKRCRLEAAFPSRYLDWFDVLARRIYIPWRSVATFHVLALVEEAPFHPGYRDEWCRRGWISFDRLRDLASTDPTGRLAFLIRQGIGDWLELARVCSESLVEATTCLVN